jgi:hypothetical protein
MDWAGLRFDVPQYRCRSGREPRIDQKPDQFPGRDLASESSATRIRGREPTIKKKCQEVMPRFARATAVPVVAPRAPLPE